MFSHFSCIFFSGATFTTTAGAIYKRTNQPKCHSMIFLFWTNKKTRMKCYSLTPCMWQYRSHKVYLAIILYSHSHSHSHSFDMFVWIVYNATITKITQNLKWAPFYSMLSISILSHTLCLFLSLCQLCYYFIFTFSSIKLRLLTVKSK